MLARSLRSAALAALVLGSQVALLVLFLNPRLVPREEAHALVRSILLPYALAAFLGFTALAALLTFIRGVRVLPRPLIEALPWFSTLSFVATAIAAGLYALNLAHHRLSIPVEFVRGMLTSGATIGVAALVLLAVIVDSWLFASRARGGAAALVILATGGSLVAPLLCLPAARAVSVRAPSSGEPLSAPRRIFVVGFDAVSPDMLKTAIEHGRGAVLARLMREGAFVPLATIRPTEGPPVWSSIWTGRLPRDHGVKSAYSYELRGSASSYEILPKGIFVSRLERAGLAVPRPVDSRTLRTKALWHVLRDHGIPTGLVRLWGTHPAEPLSPFVVSDRFYESHGVAASQSLHPPLLLDTVAPARVRPEDVDSSILSRFVAEPAGAAANAPWRQELAGHALAPDLTYERVGGLLRTALDPAFYAIYFRGPDIVGHPFFRFAHPESFGNVTPAEVRRFGGVIDGYVDFVSEAAGRLVDATRPGDVVVVVSAFGLRPMTPWRRALQALTGAPRDSATHEGGPPGFLIAWGSPVAPGATASAASVLDVAPTILYWMGVAVARDLDGEVLADILADDFARSHAITYVPSYEGAPRGR